MASGLIPKLNALVGNTPDQIVTRLSNPWIMGRHITAQTLAAWGENARLDLTEFHGVISGEPRWWLGGVCSSYTSSTWGLPTFNGHLKNYWFRLHVETPDGIWPDYALDRELRQDT